MVLVILDNYCPILNTSFCRDDWWENGGDQLLSTLEEIDYLDIYLIGIHIGRFLLGTEQIDCAIPGPAGFPNSFWYYWISYFCEPMQELESSSTV